MQKSQLNPEILQDLLDAAPNALAKGQAQYFTPEPFAAQIARHLPHNRPLIIDLQCGNAQLLRGAANPTTEHLLGCDIDPAPIRQAQRRPAAPADSPSPSAPSASPRETIPVLKPDLFQADITLLYPLMREIGFAASCFLLNPPWDLHWRRDRLAQLAESELPAVVQAFAAHDGRTTPDTIDSTIATLCLALDLSNPYGEGLIIANHATVERLLLRPGAPHSALAAHIWRIDTYPGNPCLPNSPSLSAPSASPRETTPHSPLDTQNFQTAVLYFARGHTRGPSSLANRLYDRKGPELRPYNETPTIETRKLWAALRQEWDRRQPGSKPSWNIWLDPRGRIQTHLSLFDEHTGRIPKSRLSDLAAIRNQHPLQLVLQRRQRDTLAAAAGLGPAGPIPTPWRVHPDVLPAVRKAILAYQSQRAPLYPLSPIQSIGYADEEDTLLCQQDLYPNSPPEIPNSKLPPSFRAGVRYPLETQTLTATRKTLKPNLVGELETIEHTGQELALFLEDDHGLRHTFLDARLLDGQAHIAQVDKDPARRHTLQTLVQHFLMPTVPDVATLHPEQFQNHLQTLAALEQTLSA